MTKAFVSVAKWDKQVAKHVWSRWIAKALWMARGTNGELGIEWGVRTRARHIRLLLDFHRAKVTIESFCSFAGLLLAAEWGMYDSTGRVQNHSSSMAWKCLQRGQNMLLEIWMEALLEEGTLREWLILAKTAPSLGNFSGKMRETKTTNCKSR